MLVDEFQQYPLRYPNDVSDIVVYVDTLELFFKAIPKNLRGEVERLHGKRVRIEECRCASGYIWGYRLAVHQPKTGTLALLSKLQRKHCALIRRCDIAFDFLTETRETAQRVEKVLRHHVVLKWRRKAPLVRIGETTYWGDGRRGRNIALYSDKASRTDPH
jgi:hypothetical protein